MASPTDLIRDPVFQLNVVLWLAQPLPSGYPITPVLRHAGFDIHSIAPPLAPPPDVLLALAESGLAYQQSCCPDVILERDRDRLFLVVECKGNSFGEASTTAAQARTVLVVAGSRLASLLGLPVTAVSSSMAVYLVPAAAMAAMDRTLRLLAPPLAPLGAAETGVLGLEPGERAIAIVASDLLASRLGIAHVTPFITFEPDTDPRPLYLIPYDPDCHQTAEEQEFCRRVLFERIHAAVLSRVGKLIAPAAIQFTVDALLNEATFGMSERWDSPATTKAVRRLSRDLLRRISTAVNGSRVNVFAETAPGEWTVTVGDPETHAAVIADLARFSCETMDLRAEPSPGLFD